LLRVKIDVSINRNEGIGDDGAPHLAVALQEIPQLLTLELPLKGHGIGAWGA
jgi:hypothetical protein